MRPVRQRFRGPGFKLPRSASSYSRLGYTISMITHKSKTYFLLTVHAAEAEMPAACTSSAVNPSLFLVDEDVKAERFDDFGILLVRVLSGVRSRGMT